MNRSGLLIVDKPAGMTSHQVVSRIRRILGTRKVGHAGTLDPMATGVLICGVNRATRLMGHLALNDKSYQATIRLGVVTDTEDADGQILSIQRADMSRDEICSAMNRLTGSILQRPSSVSAIKVDGKRSYARVRAGEKVELTPRPVHIAQFDLEQMRYVCVDGTDLIDLDVTVTCSSGTYIRALARDLGELLGVGASLTMLRRIRIGSYGIDQALPLDKVESSDQLMSMVQAASLSFPIIELSNPHEILDVAFGRPLHRSIDQISAVVAEDRLLGLFDRQDKIAVPKTIFLDGDDVADMRRRYGDNLLA